MKAHQINRRSATAVALLDRPMTSRATLPKLANLAFAFALISLLGACSPAPMPISRGTSDPSNPSAPEGVSPMLAAAPSTLPAEAPAGGHEHHQDASRAPQPQSAHADHAAATDGGAKGAGYVCPMHPEVTSTSPGSVCPKCNMKLVPKK